MAPRFRITVRSRHADRFNHDADAPSYDQDVQNEKDPIRAGYGALLQWVAEAAAGSVRILELGAGTGNLTFRLPASAAVTAVDISSKMLEVARTKAPEERNITWHRSDLLEFFDTPRGPFDSVVSTYAVHHLTPEEKPALFAHIHRDLAPGGRAVLGDLMFASPEARSRYLEMCRRTGKTALARDIEAEFFWDLARSRNDLIQMGFIVETRRFSDLSWGILAKKPRDA